MHDARGRIKGENDSLENGNDLPMNGSAQRESAVGKSDEIENDMGKGNNSSSQKNKKNSSGEGKGKGKGEAEAVEVVPLRLLKRSNEEQMKKLFQLIRTLPETIHYYLENFVFPAHMDNKITKLSAAGQELGGEMLFSKRIGFSGTPSDLLPVELGQCGYEKGSDGEMIHVLSSPDICSYEVLTQY